MYLHKVTKFCNSTTLLLNFIFSDRKSNTCHARDNFSHNLPILSLIFKRWLLPLFGQIRSGNPPPRGWLNGFGTTNLARWGGPSQQPQWPWPLPIFILMWEDWEKHYQIYGTCLTFHLRRQNWLTEWLNSKIL
jgi:hypothetical protein